MSAEANLRWVPVAVSADIPSGTVVPARMPTGPVAVWRAASGQLFANGDRCPHRGMRLSHGFVRGETLSCIYHGWRFGTDGACQKIPAHPAVVPPKSINCGPLAAAEADGVVWCNSGRPVEEPRDFPQHSALRSLVVAASQEVILESSGGVAIQGGAQAQLAGQDAILLMNAYGTKEVFLIVLVEKRLGTQERLAVSAAMEALRRTAEASEVAQ